MKRNLLVLCLLGGFCTLSAQKVADYSAIENGKSVPMAPLNDIEKAPMSFQKNAPYSAELFKANGESETTHEARALYRAPMGALYAALTPDWMGKTYTFLYMPALNEQTIENYCKLDSKYTGKENLGWTLSNFDDEVKSIDSLMNEDGDLVMDFYGYYYAPTVNVFAPEDAEHLDALDSYTFFRDEENPEQSYFVGGTDTLEYLGNAAVNGGIYGGFSSGGGFVSNKNFMTLELEEGATKATWKDTGKKCIGFAEYYNAPSEMLFVTSVIVNLVDMDKVAVEGSCLEGKTLTAEIRRVTEDGKLEPFATATATEENFYYSSETGSASVTFYFKEEDPIFGEMDAPVVLDNTSDYMILVKGFEQLSMEWTCVFSGADGFEGHGYAILEDGSLATIGYSNIPSIPQTDLYISFEAAIPVAQITESYQDITVMIPSEGGYGRTIYDEEEQKWYNDFHIYTLNSSEWWEEIDAPGWVDIEYDDEYVSNYGILIVYLHADALPKGTTERNGEVVLSLYGKEVVIPVMQGEIPAGINERIADSEKQMYFNVNGQQESVPMKGKVYINNGQKVMF